MASMTPPSSGGGETLTPAILDVLRRTRPWVLFLSVVGFGLSALMILAGIGFAIFSVASGTMEALVGVSMGLLYIVTALIYIIPSRYLFRYASAINQALNTSPKAPAVERALRQQKSFWKFTGILTIILFFLWIPGIIAAIALPNLLNAMQRAKQHRTMADMRTIGTAVEAYQIDQREYPRATSIDELAQKLQPKYIRQLPLVDGWKNKYEYSSDGASYHVASGGKDGQLERQNLDRQIAGTSFDNDLVFSNGAFTQYPAGTTSPQR